MELKKIIAEYKTNQNNMDMDRLFSPVTFSTLLQFGRETILEPG